MPNIAKPTRLKQLAGNPGKRAINRKEPKPTGRPTAPEIISATALAVWQSVVSAMPPGVYAATDTALLAAFCEAVANHREATAALTKEPKMVTGSTGQPALNPWFKHQTDQARLIVQLGARLGLDPVARQGLYSDAPGDEGGKFEIN